MPLARCWILVAFCLVVLLACLAASTSPCDEAPPMYGAANTNAQQAIDARDTRAGERTANVALDVDALSTELPLPLPVLVPSDGKRDGFTQEVFARNEAAGQIFQQEISDSKPTASSGVLQQIAQKVERDVVLAASPDPPRFEPLSLDVLPQKYWQPVFSGCQSTFTDERCDFSYPTPRLWVPNLNELQYARSLEQGRTNLIEPLEARQAMAQLLSLGVRTRRDVYTQATPANDIAAQSPCAHLKQQSPSYVWR